jgi:hypothetical protein
VTFEKKKDRAPVYFRIFGEIPPLFNHYQLRPYDTSP